MPFKVAWLGAGEAIGDSHVQAANPYSKKKNKLLNKFIVYTTPKFLLGAFCYVDIFENHRILPIPSIPKL